MVKFAHSGPEPFAPPPTQDAPAECQARQTGAEGPIFENSFPGETMELIITPYDPDDLPNEEQIPLPDPGLYEAVGGEEGFARMIENFYDRIVESDIAFFFPQEEEEIGKIKEHNGKYFAEIAGGPKRYSEEMGHVDQIAMHKPFSINEKHRTEWLGTWREVLEEIAKDVDPPLVESYFRFLDTYSKLLINRPVNARSFEDLAKV